MGLFSSKKQIFVSSVVYNLAGPLSNRKSFLKTSVVREVLNQDPKRYIGAGIVEKQLNGPAFQQRSFFRWAKENYESGVLSGKVNNRVRINSEDVAEFIQTEPNEVATIQKAQIDSGDYIYWVEKFIMENRPDKYNEEWVADYIYSENTATIQYEDGTSEQIVLTGYNSNSFYVFVYYSVRDINSGGILEIGELFTDQNNAPDTSEYSLVSSSFSTQEISISDTRTTVTQISENEFVTETDTFLRTESFYSSEQKYKKSETYVPDTNNDLLFENVYNLWIKSKPLVVESYSESTTTDENGYTTTTTWVTKTINTIWDYKTDVLKDIWISENVEKPRLYIYEIGTGNLTLDALLVDQNNDMEFYPVIPLRIDNVSVRDPKFAAFFPVWKKAYKKSVKANINKILDTIEDNPQLEDIDYAYIVNGVELNTKENFGKQYTYEFLKSLIPYQGNALENFNNWISQNIDNEQEYKTLLAEWETDQQIFGPLWGTPAPVRKMADVPAMSSVDIKSIDEADLNFHFRLNWIALDENVKTGQGKPGVKVGEIWWEVLKNYNGTETPDFTVWSSQATGTTLDLFDAVYHNGLWVVVGDGGTILTSKDRVKWTLRVSNMYPNLKKVSYGNGLWVAVGEWGTILTSPNGIEWTRRYGSVGYSDSYFADVSYSDGLWVAVGRSIVTSEDGITWTYRKGFNKWNEMRFVKKLNNLWITGGSQKGIYTSEDAIVWTEKRIFHPSTYYSFNTAHYADGKWVVAGTEDTIIYSTDGINWIYSSSKADSLNGLHYANGLWIAVGGNSGTIVHSKDGITWTRSQRLNRQFTDVNYDPVSKTWIAVGSTDGSTDVSGPIIVTSSDGVNWTLQNSGTNSLINKIVSGDGSWIAVARDGTILTPGASNWSHVRLNWQFSESSFKYIDVYGMVHENIIYKGKSVKIDASEALQDEDESGFIIPLHEPSVRKLGIIDSNELCLSSQQLVFNCYLVKKVRWYERLIFKLILSVVLSIVFMPAGVGILGTNAAVGASLGLSGAAAIFAGAIANSIAAVALSIVIQTGATAIFGEKLGAIIGALATAFTFQYISNFHVTGSWSFNWGDMLKVDNLLKLTDSVAGSVQNWAAAEMKNISAESIEAAEDFQRQSREIEKLRQEIFGYGGAALDPLMFTQLQDSSRKPVESSATFLTRTLLTGSEIADLSLSMIGSFPELSLRLPTAFE